MLRMLSIILLLTILILRGQTCTSTSCGAGGTCTGSGFCICGSNFEPDPGVTSCSNVPSCTPANYSLSANTSSLSQFDSSFCSSFGAGMWNFNFTFDTINDASRDVFIYNSTGYLCAQMSAEIASAISLATLNWTQSVDSTNAPNCQDVIQGSLTWQTIAPCLQSTSNGYLFQGTVTTMTTVYGEANTSSSIRQDSGSAYNTSRQFSFLFDASVNATSLSESFYINEGQFQVNGSFFTQSYSLDPVALTLTVSFEQYLTYPMVIIPTGYNVSGINIPASVTVGSPTCTSSICSIPVTVVFDVSGQNCAGFSNQDVSLTFETACYSGAPSSTCTPYVNALAGANVTDSFLLSAEWCPVNQTTQLSSPSFDLYNGSTPVYQGEVIIDPQITGVITINATSQVAGSVLDLANITYLALTDGTNTTQVDSFTPLGFSAENSTGFFCVNFSHSPNPDDFPYINFTLPVYYTATVEAYFGASKKRASPKRLSSKLGKRLSKSRKQLRSPSVVQASSISFIIGVPKQTQQQSSSPVPTSEPSSQGGSGSSSSNTVALAVGLGVGIGGAALLALSVVIILKLKNKNKLGAPRVLEENI